MIMLPYGNIIYNDVEYTPKEIGDLVKKVRKGMDITQKELALAAGTGIRFIIELEKGKDKSQLGKVLIVLRTLGIKLIFTLPIPQEENKQ